MGLSTNRIRPGAETEHRREREAIDFVLAGLPDGDPFIAYPLQEFVDQGTGRIYELDLLVLGRHALYLVEIKSHSGTLSGDSRDWLVCESGRYTPLENPLFLAERKAKVLATLLRRALADLKLEQFQWARVEALVFLSNPDLENRLQPIGRTRVIDRRDPEKTILRAITHGDYVGADRSHQRVINAPAMRAVDQALKKIGLGRPRLDRRVGQYLLGALLNEGEGWQEHEGKHVSIPGRSARVRSYLVPRATVPERRTQLERAARREAEVLTHLGEHPQILRCLDYVDTAPLGPALVFEPFDEALPLDVFLRARTDLSFDDRMEIMRQIAEPLDYCHRHGVLHRNLCPATVLVRQGGDDTPQVRLHGFQLSMRDEGTRGTLHLSALSEKIGAVYQAPEVNDDPTKATTASDVFSLGALAFLIFTGQHPPLALAERDRQLRETDGLRVSSLRDDLSLGVDEVIANATDYYAARRADSAITWFSLLEDEATRPEPLAAEPGIDPRRAEKGSELDGGLSVQGVLGSGATARVLWVTHGGRDYALKVPHDASCAEKLASEAEILKQLRHPHIVECHGVHRISGWDCVLLDLVGPPTLADQLREEGTIGLDYARRFGEDLLSALQYLEERSGETQHRDVKPANIGFTRDPKRKRHLVLFDFSLSAMDAEHVEAGTPVYRDPGLRSRGRWDAAADRYAAAIVLYEMLVGARPAEEAQGSGKVLLQAERFDAAIRDGLVDFFARALHHEVSQRFASAEAMRTAWTALLGAPALPARVPETAGVPIEVAPETLPPSVTPITPVDALPLSTRARNALDRAGVTNITELLMLPRNHLSAVRGVGRKVAREIQDAAEELRARFTTLADGTPAFIPSFSGRKVLLRPGPAFALSAESHARLRDAGITTTADLCSAPADRVSRILGEEAGHVREAVLAGRAELAPRTLGQLLDELLTPSRRKPSKADRQVRALLGVETLPGAKEAPGAADAPESTQVARAFGVSRQAVSAALQRAREEWEQCAGRGALIVMCQEVVEALGGVCPLADAARELAEAEAGEGVAGPEALRQAAAVLRIATELRTGEDGASPLCLRRLNGEAWVGLNPPLLDLARQLGKAADELCAHEPLPSTEKVRVVLAGIVQDSPLAPLSASDLVELAARASSKAARSTRLELYPRGMPSERALELSAAMLSLGGLKPADVRMRVGSRYPDATPLPDRPELDALIGKYGLCWSPDEGAYVRPGRDLPSVTSTRMAYSRLRTAAPQEPRLGTPEAVEAQAFHETLRTSVERGRFRVLQVVADQADAAGELLGESLGVNARSLDHLLWSHIQKQCETRRVELERVMEADREGPGGAHWPLLLKLVQAAAASMIEEILAHRGEPQVLVHPGTLARYGLARELDLLVQRAEADDGAAVLLVLPCHDDGSPPSINNRLPVPAPLPGQRLRVPRSWLENKHRAAAEPAVV